MSTAPLLDTHAWVWWVHGDHRLGVQTLKALDELTEDNRPAICDISSWEVATLVARGRLNLKVNLGQWFDLAAHPRTVRVLPITTRIATEVASFPDSVHRDPADRIIISTARAHGLALLTRDEAIIKSGMVRLWSAGTKSDLDYRILLPRLYELKDSLTDPNHPDAYFKAFESNLRSPHVFDRYRKLEAFLSPLDPQSWVDLRDRATSKLISRQRDEGRGWQELFDVLNEAIGYSYLRGRGCEDVRFLKRTDENTPDLSATLDRRSVLCEVKTLNVSKDQAEHLADVGRGKIIVTKVDTEFGRMGSLQSKMKKALTQLRAYDPSGAARHVVFVVLNFDDWVGDYHDRYFAQIDDFLDALNLEGTELVFYPTTNAFERTYAMRNATVYLG